MNKVTFLICVLTLPVFLAFKQEEQPTWKLLKTLQAPHFEQASTDPYFNIYFSDSEGNILKFDSTGKNTAGFSSRKTGSVTLLDASRNVNVFAFYRNYQQVKFFTRFLTENSSISIRNINSVGYARLMCPSLDNNFWIFDDTDLTLKKINSTYNQVELTTELALSLPAKEFDFVYMREFENNLFISDRLNGIWVFDNIGNFKTRITAYNSTFFGFYKNHIYYLENDQLTLVDLKTGKKDLYDLPDNLKINQIILSHNKACLFQTNQFHIYDFQLNN